MQVRDAEGRVEEDLRDQADRCGECVVVIRGSDPEPVRASPQVRGWSSAVGDVQKLLPDVQGEKVLKGQWLQLSRCSSQ